MTTCTVYIAQEYAEWQIEVLKSISQYEDKAEIISDWRKPFIANKAELGGKKGLAKYLKFGAMICVFLHF